VRVIEVLGSLKKIGVGLALDDFGTGSSSLSYLKRLPVDELKIDRSFVMAMQESGADEVIVRSTTELAQRLGLRVVAEGVETEAVWDQLANIGCDEAQGYFLQRPIPARQFADWITAWNAAEQASKGALERAGQRRTTPAAAQARAVNSNGPSPTPMRRRNAPESAARRSSSSDLQKAPDGATPVGKGDHRSPKSE
jgi:predicted signal transduction protein with EAL and GGDEF domain